MALVDPVTFALNLSLLVGLLIVLAVLIVTVIAAWTGMKVSIWRFRQKKAEQQERQRKLRPDGQPYPPAARGTCDECARSLDLVYHLPSGRRLCPTCYHRLEVPAQAPAPPKAGVRSGQP
jgi:hypothetical protein